MSIVNKIKRSIIILTYSRNTILYSVYCIYNTVNNYELKKNFIEKPNSKLYDIKRYIIYLYINRDVFMQNIFKYGNVYSFF